MASEQANEARAPGPVVVVDDDRVDRRVAGQCLGRSKLHGLPVVSLSSGEQLLDLLDEVKTERAPMPSLVLLDLSMPRMNGFELLSRLRSDPRFASEPYVVVMSTSHRDADRDRALELGAQLYVPKPSASDDYVALFDSLA